MPKRIPKEQKRVSLSCLIAPRTMALINEAVAAIPEWSQGGVIDRAVGLFHNRLNAQGLTFEEQRAEITRHELEMREAIVRHESKPLTDWRANHKPLLKPGEK